MNEITYHEYLVTTLNTNSVGLVFKGEAFFDININGNFSYEKLVTGTYRTETIEYLPTQIAQWNNTQQPYNEIDLNDLATPLRIACREYQLEDTLTALEEFRLALNGATATIDGYNVGFRIARPTTPVPPQSDGGHDWVVLEIVVMLSSGLNLLYGNTPLANFKMALASGTLENMVASKVDIISTTETNPSTKSGEVKVSNHSRTIQIDVELFYVDNITLSDEFLDWLWGDLAYSQKFDISIKYSDTITKTKTVVLVNVQQSLQHGVPIGFKMQMIEAL